MWNAVEEHYYGIDKIADKFITSEYNNISLDGSDLQLKVNEFLRANRNDRKLQLSDLQIEMLLKSLLGSFQRQIRYRFYD